MEAYGSTTSPADIVQRPTETRPTGKPLFGPAIDGLLWKKGRAEDRPRTPVLSILEFKFKPGVDLSDIHGVPRKLWDNSLQYIWSIPGCASIEWGLTLDDSTNVLCMIQWETAASWQMFQDSLGFSLIIGLLGANVDNRCSKLAHLAAPTSTCSNQPTILEMISITFDSDMFPEHKTSFEQEWTKGIALFSNEIRLHDRAYWLEHNASMFAEPTADDIAASRCSTTFVGFLECNRTGYNSHATINLCKDAEGKASTNIQRSLSRKAIKLIKETRKQDAGLLPLPSAPFNSLATILETNFRRQFSHDPNLRLRGLQAVLASIKEVGEGTRRFPLPKGSLNYQGELHLDNMPTIGQFSHFLNSSRPPFIMDIVWLKLKSAMPRKTHDIIRELNDRISRLSGHEKTFWARDVEHTTKVVIFTAWRDQPARAASIEQYYQILDVFAALGPRLAAPLKHETIPWSRPNIGGLQFPRAGYIELITFSVPRGLHNRLLFEQAFAAFKSVTEPSHAAGIPTACSVYTAGGWQLDDAFDLEAEDMDRFTGVLTWTL
ncbi:antibiotic biosynthesis monooxygenase domain-containing protein [Pochonia chlamydosporia 170]|uniref:Antibiotic biosynthesis monooxygenase domain-containing protein n=1 Tax=Pochonia chlamydosporia 170 TaxID=1380566 RepID=A0A179EYD2_METCM|nr:antibiotic biosynthesis monooxygenase domain-containing protein [Pochonia chlamydosporia 170]OAQ58205.1 antibiotic biosynthesis monooxygenase domain-containing protein [Pochonia chlamydosporia 170]